MILPLVALVCTIVRQDPQNDRLQLENCLTMQARQHMKALGVARKIDILVRPEREIPHKNVSGFIIAKGDRCVATLASWSERIGQIRMPREVELTLAHEACHCAHDWDEVLVKGGYRTREQRTLREQAAEECAEKLVGYKRGKNGK